MECIYDDFSFLALGESAPWEFTPFTPLAKSKAHIQISYNPLIADGHHAFNIMCLMFIKLGAFPVGVLMCILLLGEAISALQTWAKNLLWSSLLTFVFL